MMINHPSVRGRPVVQMQIRLFIFVTLHCEEIVALPFPRCVACIYTSRDDLDKFANNTQC